MKTEGKATTAIFHEVRRETKNGLHPVKLRVTFRRQRKYYTLQDPQRESLHLSTDTFADVMKIGTGEKKSKVPGLTKEEKKELRLHLAGIETKAQEIINKLPVFSFEGFERLYFSKSDTGDLFACMENKAKMLRKEGRISTAVTYECALKSIKLFHQKKTLRFEQVTVAFLRRYHDWMIKKDNTKTTIGIYLRTVRVVYNEARRGGELNGVMYPFGKAKEGLYQIPTGTNRKKALTIEDVSKIAHYTAPDGSADEKYRDLWMFSFFCNGINIKDVAGLKYRNIDDDIISLIRAKTERETEREPKPIEIVIIRQVGRILDRWGNKPGLPDTYLFPIFDHGMDAERKYKRVQDFVRRINRSMERISENLELPTKATTYTARHSFATVLKRSGASVAFISEALGHTNQQTTERYLAKFEDQVKREWAAKLAENI